MQDFLNRFNKTAHDKDKDITQNISSSGDFTKISGIDSVLNSWFNILVTPKETYDNDPEYGSNLHKFIFEQADDTTKDLIKNEIITDLMFYDPRAIVEKIDITFLSDRKGFNVNIYARYNNNEVKSINVPITEDLLNR